MVVIVLIIRSLLAVELWVELGWNYVKFHPNSTRNSTSHNPLIIITITAPRWKGGITNEKIYFSVKKMPFCNVFIYTSDFYFVTENVRIRKIRIFEGTE